MLSKIKNVMYLMISLILISVGEAGCSKIYNIDSTSGAEDILIQITENLSYNIDSQNNKSRLINSFVLTDMKRVRKLSLREAEAKGLLGEGLYGSLKETFPDDSFVLLMWDKWYREWKSGKITPYFTYDPMINESKITSVVLYKKGKPVKTIDIKEFDDYPVIVVSPKWWEGDFRNSTSAYNGDRENNLGEKTISKPHIFKIKVNGWYDGSKSWHNPGWRMEIYTITYPIVHDSLSHKHVDHNDFNSVDEGYKWYSVNGNVHPGYSGYVGFRTQVWEDDGGLRFGDDYVGTITINGNYYHYTSGGHVEVYCVNNISY